MALLDICEYAGVRPPSTTYEGVPVAAEPALAFQQVTFTATAANSAPLSSQTRVVRLIADSICRVRVSTAGTAVTAGTGFRMSLGVPEYFSVRPGDIISVIVASP